MEESQYQMRVEGSLTAHFFQPDGSSRPITDRSVALQHGDNTYQLMVQNLRCCFKIAKGDSTWTWPRNESVCSDTR